MQKKSYSVSYCFKLAINLQLPIIKINNLEFYVCW